MQVKQLCRLWGPMARLMSSVSSADVLQALGVDACMMEREILRQRTQIAHPHTSSL